jgi:hypothetical protein
VTIFVAQQQRRSVAGRAWAAIAAAWGIVTAVLPHVLHHVGPLAGAALLAGAGGTALFAVIGFAASIPFLLRLHRRFRTWAAPAVALVLFAGMFTFSSLVIVPAITGSDNGSTPVPALEQPAGHASHHSK